VRRTAAVFKSWRERKGCSARANSSISRWTVWSPEPSEITITSNSGNWRASSESTLATMLTSSS
jgi:hypothetical protein